MSSRLPTAQEGPAALSGLRYRSRPDLVPPQLNITIRATNDVAPGYIFVTPCALFGKNEHAPGAPEQPGAYIFRDDGDLVWSGAGFFSGWTANFQATRYKGQPVLQAFQGTLSKRHGHAYGAPILLDQSYRPVAEVQSLSKLVSFHEFKIIGEKTALVQVPQPRIYDLSKYGGKANQRWIIDDIFQEIDIETGKVIFEGRSLAFSDPSESFVPLGSSANFKGTDASTAWDYFHTNSVDKDDQGNYLVSGRHVSTIFKISGRDGSVIWRLGGRHSTFRIPDDRLQFAFQHDARFVSRWGEGDHIETISLMDNHARSDHPIPKQHGHDAESGTGIESTGRIIQLNHHENAALEVKRLIPPDHLLSGGQGNIQLLPNGNIFACWGVCGAVTEYLCEKDSRPIFHANLIDAESGEELQSYRGFRCPWEGRPRETPALVAMQERRGGDIWAYVSWNGDTRTREWRFFSVEKKYVAPEDSALEIGVAKRSGFETSVRIPGDTLEGLEANLVMFADALDEDGQVIGRSDSVEIWLDPSSVPEEPQNGSTR